MLVIRFLRTGKKNQPFFRIVVTDKRNPPRGGRFVEILGSVNPLTKKRTIKKERVQYWLSKGAKPSDTVYNLLVTEKVIKGKKAAVHKKKKSKEGEKPIEAAIIAGQPKTETAPAPTQEIKQQSVPVPEPPKIEEPKKEEVKG